MCPSDNKVRAIRDINVPNNVKDLKSVLGLFGFYRLVIHNYALIVAPLNALLKKNVHSDFGDKCLHAFQLFK